MKPVKFFYKNHRGEIQERTIIPDAVEFIFTPHPDYHYQPGWFLSGFDVEKNGRRSFALVNILVDQGEGLIENAAIRKFFKLNLEN